MSNIKIIYKKTINIICIILLFFLFSNICLAETEDNISSKIKKCAACHTLNGNSITPIWPKIAEQHSDYLLKQLLEYKKGKQGNRFDPTMFSMLQELNENDMTQLAEYFSKQTLEKSKIKFNESAFAYGKNLYLYGDKNNKIIGCVGCHGIDATGNKLANFPNLKWQHKEYIILQLKKFQTHERSNDMNYIMQDIVINMSNEQIDALATYISCIE
ncbi:MAG TPA: c-type cytochrome [Candidatus Azoamicus sp. OHIO2]